MLLTPRGASAITIQFCATILLSPCAVDMINSERARSSARGARKTTRFDTRHAARATSPRKERAARTHAQQRATPRYARCAAPSRETRRTRRARMLRALRKRQATQRARIRRDVARESARARTIPRCRSRPPKDIRTKSATIRPARPGAAVDAARAATYSKAGMLCVRRMRAADGGGDACALRASHSVCWRCRAARSATRRAARATTAHVLFRHASHASIAAHSTAVIRYSAATARAADYYARTPQQRGATPIKRQCSTPKATLRGGTLANACYAAAHTTRAIPVRQRHAHGVTPYEDAMPPPHYIPCFMFLFINAFKMALFMATLNTRQQSRAAGSNMQRATQRARCARSARWRRHAYAVAVSRHVAPRARSTTHAAMPAAPPCSRTPY